MTHHVPSAKGKNCRLTEAKTIASLLPAIMGRLFAADDRLAAELPLAQLRVCVMLFDEPHPMSVLSRELGVSLSAMTQIADRLERAQMARRVSLRDDRRVRCLQLTPRGRKIMQLRQHDRVRRVSVVLRHLPPKSRERVVATLQTLIRACAATREHDGEPKQHDGHSLAFKALR